MNHQKDLKIWPELDQNQMKVHLDPYLEIAAYFDL